MHAHIHTVMLKFPNEYLMNKHFNCCKNFKMKDNVCGTVKVETVPLTLEKIFDGILRAKSVI